MKTFEQFIRDHFALTLKQNSDTFFEQEKILTLSDAVWFVEQWQKLEQTHVMRRAFVNVYDGADCRFLSDEDYDSYEAAYEGRDQLSSYVETVEVVRQHGA